MPLKSIFVAAGPRRAKMRERCDCIFFLTIVVISGRQKMWYPPRWERSIQAIFLDWGELVVVYGKLHPVLEQQLLRPPLVDEIQ